MARQPSHSNKGKHRATPLVSRPDRNTVNTVSPPCLYYCKVPECGESFEEKKALTNHQRVHRSLKDRPFRCIVEDCNFTANDKGGVKIHNESVHLKLRKSCSECGITYSDPSGLTHHMGKAHPEVAEKRRAARASGSKSTAKQPKPSQDGTSLTPTDIPYDELPMSSLIPSFDANWVPLLRQDYETSSPSSSSSATGVWHPQPSRRLPTAPLDSPEFYPVAREESDATHQSGSYFDDAASANQDISRRQEFDFVYETQFEDQRDLNRYSRTNSQESLNSTAGPSSVDSGYHSQSSAASAEYSPPSGYVHLSTPDPSYVPDSSQFVGNHGASVQPQYDMASSTMAGANLAGILPSTSTEPQSNASEDPIAQLFAVFGVAYNPTNAFVLTERELADLGLLPSSGPTSRVQQPDEASSAEDSYHQWNYFSSSSSHYDH